MTVPKCARPDIINEHQSKPLTRAVSYERCIQGGQTRIDRPWCLFRTSLSRLIPSSPAGHDTAGGPGSRPFPQADSSIHLPTPTHTLNPKYSTMTRRPPLTSLGQSSQSIFTGRLPCTTTATIFNTSLHHQIRHLLPDLPSFRVRPHQNAPYNLHQDGRSPPPQSHLCHQRPRHGCGRYWRAAQGWWPRVREHEPQQHRVNCHQLLVAPIPMIH